MTRLCPSEVERRAPPPAKETSLAPHPEGSIAEGFSCSKNARSCVAIVIAEARCQVSRETPWGSPAPGLTPDRRASIPTTLCRTYECGTEAPSSSYKEEDLFGEAPEAVSQCSDADADGQKTENLPWWRFSDRCAPLAHRCALILSLISGERPRRPSPPVGSGAARRARRDDRIMSVSDAPPCVCGGSNMQSARTDHVGEGDDAVLYLHYWLKCSLCGRMTEDSRMRFLNAAGIAGARAHHG
jgi:hypothetical protein